MKTITDTEYTNLQVAAFNLARLNTINSISLQGEVKDIKHTNYLTQFRLEVINRDNIDHHYQIDCEYVGESKEVKDILQNNDFILLTGKLYATKKSIPIIKVSYIELNS